MGICNTCCGVFVFINISYRLRACLCSTAHAQKCHVRQARHESRYLHTVLVTQGVMSLVTIGKLDTTTKISNKVCYTYFFTFVSTHKTNT